MSEAPTTVIEPVPTTTPPVPASPAPAANTPEARTPEGQIKAVTEPLIPTPQTPTATTTEPKTEEKTQEKTLLNEKQEMNGAPEKYGDFVPPEGYEFRGETMDGARALFKELNLSQVGAQRLVDFHAAELKAAMEAPAKQWEETRAQWLAEVKSDPDIGGRLDQVKSTVARAIDGLGDPKLASEFRQAMDFTGAGNNPAFIRAFYKLAQKLTEGTSVTGGTMVEVNAKGDVVRNQPPSAARALYPGLK